MQNPEINKDQWYLSVWYRFQEEISGGYVYKEVYDGVEQYVDEENNAIKGMLHIRKDRFLGQKPPEFITVNLEGRLGS